MAQPHHDHHVYDWLVWLLALGGHALGWLGTHAADVVSTAAMATSVVIGVLRIVDWFEGRRGRKK